MRIPRWAGLLALAALAFWLGQGSSNLSAQALLPDGVFVRDSGGTIWLITGGQRAKVPFLPATDEAINSVPDSGQFVVAGEGGALALGPQPAYVNAQPISLQAAATATPTAAPEDPAPTVSISVDDANIQVGQTVRVQVIGHDNHGIEWMQWEGTIQEDDDNDNKATGDSDLDAEHRQDCNGNTECAMISEITPKVAGRFVLRARARDDNGTRSEWVKIEFRVRGSNATATPTPTPPAASTNTAPGGGSPTP